jgi:hypothetical protein
MMIPQAKPQYIREDDGAQLVPDGARTGRPVLTAETRKRGDNRFEQS